MHSFYKCVITQTSKKRPPPRIFNKQKGQYKVVSTLSVFMHNYDEFSHIADLPRLAHYLRYLLQVHKGDKPKGLIERISPRYKLNVRRALNQLRRKLDFTNITSQELKELDAALFEIEGTHDLLILSEKAASINRLLNKMKTGNIERFLDVLVKADKENKKKADKLQDFIMALRTKEDVAEAMSGKFVAPPPFDAFVSIYKNLVSFVLRWTQWRAIQYDPLLKSKGGLKKPAIKLAALGSFISFVASIAVILKYYNVASPLLGILGGPVIFLAAAGVSLGGRLIALAANITYLYREIKARKPRESYQLRVLDQVGKIIQSLMSCSVNALIFVAALAVVAAFANPIGLPILFGVAAGVAVFSLSIQLFSKFYLDKKIAKIQANLKTKKFKKKSSRKIANRKKLSPFKELRAEKQVTYTYSSSDPFSVKILTKEKNLSVEHSKWQVQSAAEEQGQTYTCVRSSEKPHQYKIVDASRSTGGRRLAEVEVFKSGSKYHISPDVQELQIRTLLKAIKKNNTEKMILSGKNLGEILKIYKVALREKIPLQLSKEVAEKFKALSSGSPLKKEWRRAAVQMRRLKARVSEQTAGLNQEGQLLKPSH